MRRVWAILVLLGLVGPVGAQQLPVMVNPQHNLARGLSVALVSLPGVGWGKTYYSLTKKGHATFVNTAALSWRTTRQRGDQGKVGPLFDGANDYLNLGDVFNIVAQDFSIVMSVVVDAYGTGGNNAGVFLQRGGETNGYQFGRDIFGAGGYEDSFGMVLYRSASTHYVSSVPGYLTVGTAPHHIAFTRKGTVAKLYHNGREVVYYDSPAIGTDSATGDTVMGRYSPAVNHHHNGLIYDVFLYDGRALSPRDVQQLYLLQTQQYRGFLVTGAQLAPVRYQQPSSVLFKGFFFLDD